MTTVREDGTRQIIGFVNMSLVPNATPEGLAGETLDVSTIGILIFTSPVGSGVSFGYARELTTGLKNDALAVGAWSGAHVNRLAGAAAETSKPYVESIEGDTK